MFVKDPFIHLITQKDGVRVAVLKDQIIHYEEFEKGVSLRTKDFVYEVTMPYDEVKAALTVTIC